MSDTQECYGITSEEVRKAAQKMRRRFLVPFDAKTALAEIAEIPAPKYQQPTTAFCDAMQGVISMASLPYLLASSKASALHFQRFHMAERIRSIPIDENESEDDQTKELRERRSYERAQAAFVRFQESEAGINTLVGEISSTLLESLDDSAISQAARDLLYQSLVALWTAFEVLVRDTLTAMLNTDPELSDRLLNDEIARRYFELPRVTLTKISELGFDLSAKMGDLLFGSRDFSDLRVIKAAAKPLLGDDVAKALGDKDLWLLNQDRHLIVHRHGVVDAGYLRNAGTKCQIGEFLAVSPTRLEEYFLVIARCSKPLLARVAALTEQSSSDTVRNSEPRS